MHIDELLLENKKLITIGNLQYHDMCINLKSNGDNFNYKVIFVCKKNKLNENYIVIKGYDHYNDLFNENAKINYNRYKCNSYDKILHDNIENYNKQILINNVEHDNVLIAGYNKLYYNNIFINDNNIKQKYNEILENENINHVVIYNEIRHITNQYNTATLVNKNNYDISYCYVKGIYLIGNKINSMTIILNYKLFNYTQIELTNPNLLDKYIYYIPIDNYEYGSNIINYDKNHKKERDNLLFIFGDKYTGKITFITINVFAIREKCGGLLFSDDL